MLFRLRPLSHPLEGPRQDRSNRKDRQWRRGNLQGARSAIAALTPHRLPFGGGPRMADNPKAKLVPRLAGAALARYIRFVERTAWQTAEMGETLEAYYHHHPCIIG